LEKIKSRFCLEGANGAKHWIQWLAGAIVRNGCLFLGLLDEEKINIPKKLNLQNIDKYVNDISQNMRIRGITKEDFFKEAQKI